jgi:urease accessory protein
MTTVNAMIQLREINSPAMRPAGASDKHLQRANCLCRIVVGGSAEGNEIVDVFQRSPLRVIFPRIGGARVKEAVLINTAGGIAGGDRLECDVTASANASIAVTSQTAERVYRALDKPTHILTKLKVSDGARLAWFPQETIIFNWARLHRKTEVEISPGAELLALEWLVFGRAAHGEQIFGGELRDRWRVKKDCRLIWADTFHVGEEVFPHLKRRALLGNCRAIATLIYFGSELHKQLELWRDISGSLDCLCAATSVGGLIIVRLAADTSSNLKIALRALLQQLGPEFGPGPFRVRKMWSC